MDPGGASAAVKDTLRMQAVRPPTAPRTPPLPRDVVERPRLAAKLDEALIAPLTLVAAPAGFGKTTVLLAWAAGRAERLVWLSGEVLEDGPSFWPSLLDALGGTATSEPAFDAVVRTLEEAPDPVIVVVDDFHRLRARAVLGPFGKLIANPPPNAHFVIATRRDPQLPLHRLRLAGHIVELRTRDLAFQPPEAEAFFAAAGVELTDELVTLLLDRTEGWAAALRFAEISLRANRERESFVRALAQTERAVSEYLVAEVLSAQPASRREFLLCTSICERFDGALADELTGGTDGERILTELERDHVFVELDADGRWYRYHRVFAKLLRAELQRSDPRRLRELHRRAAEWLADSGDELEALQPALAANDAVIADRLVAELWVEIDGRGDDRLARAIVEQLAPAAIGERPHLALLAAWERLRQGDVAESRAWLKLADAGRAALDPTGRAAFDFGRCVVELRRTRRTGDLDAVDRVLERFARPQPMLGRAGDGRQSLMLAARGITAAWRGELDTALTTLEAALDAARRARLGALETEVSGMLALVLAFRGDLARAARLARPLVAEADAEAGDVADATAGLLALSRCNLDWDDPEEARELAERARATAEALGDRVARATARALSLSAVACSGDHEDLARLELAALELEEGSAGLPGLVRPLVDVCRVQLEETASTGEEGPELRVALARARLDEDDLDGASELLDAVLAERSTLKATRVEAAVLRGVAAERSGGEDAARAFVELALGLAESDAIRRPFTSGGPEVVAILRRTIRYGTAHRWLVGSLLAVVDGREARDGHRARELLEPLSVRETVVLRYLPTLLSNQEIAGELFVSVNTVKTHLKSIYRKLGVSDRREAVKLARELRLVG
jgi:LuxR family maltose regulon positive regulatory protein